MSDGPEPSPLEKRLPFGCGFSFGAVAAFILIGKEVETFIGPFWAAVGGVALIAALLAVRYGDGFWRVAANLFRWY